MKKVIIAQIIITLFFCGCGASIGVGTVQTTAVMPAADDISAATVETTTTVTEVTTTATKAASLPIATSTLDTQRLSSTPLREMKVHYVDVGQSDCIVVELPNGDNMMIDAGSNNSEQAVMAYLRSKNIKNIKYIFGTHPHEDHIGSLDAVLYAFSIENLFMPHAVHNTRAFEDVLTSVEDNKLTVKYPKAGDLIINDSNIDLYMRVMAPAKDEYTDLNNYSIVLKLAYIDVSFLFTGDAEDILEYEMIDSGLNLDVDVLKVGHHGSDTSTSEAFLMATTPEYAVISVGRDNTYGHPAQSVIKKLNDAGIKVYRTDEAGTITASTNGKQISFEFEHESVEQVATSAVSTTAALSENNTPANSRSYIGNKNSKIFHSTSCRSLPKESNRVYYSNRDDAIKAGYTACKICKP